MHKQDHEIRRQREYTFHGTRSLTFAVLSLSAVAVGSLLIARGHDIWRYNPIVLSFALPGIFWGWSTRLATFICRRLGLSLDCKIIEKIERKNIISPEQHLLGQTPIIIGRGCLTFFFPSVYTVLTYCVALAMLNVWYHSQNLFEAIAVVLMFSALLTITVVMWSNVLKPELRADAQGIGFCDTSGFSSRVVKWQRVAYCDIIIVRNVFGEITDKYPILRDARHKKLMSIRLVSCSTQENKRNTEDLISFIRVRLTGEQQANQSLQPTPSGYACGRG